MSTLATINSGDQITNSRADINGNFAALNSDKEEVSNKSTDSTFASADDTTYPTTLATKQYVDAGGNVNASTTGKGIVEEAIDAEVVAGTDTGGSGARLFVPPSKLNTQIDAKIAANEAARIPFYQQTIPFSVPSSYRLEGCGSNADGSALYLVVDNGNAFNRYGRDATTGMYFLTHTVNATFAPNPNCGVIVIGSYVYVIQDDNTNIKAVRFLAADLSDEQIMTVPTVANGNNTVRAWTDGTYAYIVGVDSQTTSRKWSVSGTTFSEVSTATVTTGIFANANSCSVWDGTNAYIIDNSISATAVTIRKLTAIDGSSYTTTTVNLAAISDADFGAVAAPIGSSGELYIGKCSVNYDEAAAISASLHLFPVTKP